LSTIAVIEIINTQQSLLGPDYQYLTAKNVSQASLPPLDPGIRAYTASIRLGPGIPAKADVCQESLLSANCTYDLATGALSSQLITQTSYDFGGTTFTPPYGTRGLAYDTLVGVGQPVVPVSDYRTFPTLLVDYCLPILDPKTVFYTHDTSNSRVNYTSQGTIRTSNIYRVTLNPETYPDTHVRIDSQNGTMTIAQGRDPSEPENTIITASGIYADILSQLTYGLNVYSTTNIFTTVCTIRTYSSWQWVSFHSNRYTSVFPNDIYCGSGYPEGSDFTNLYYAIEGATRLVSGPDGYSRYLNLGIVQGNTLTNEEFRNSTAEDEQTYAYIYNMT
jgi:hypothetical protein